MTVFQLPPLLHYAAALALRPLMCCRRRHIDATVTLVQHHWTASARCPLKSRTDMSALCAGAVLASHDAVSSRFSLCCHASASAAVSSRFSIGCCFSPLQHRPLFPHASASAAVSALWPLHLLSVSHSMSCTASSLSAPLSFALSLSLSIIFFFDKENII